MNLSSAASLPASRHESARSPETAAGAVNVGALLTSVADRYSDALAVVVDGVLGRGGATPGGAVTFSQLEALSNRFASGLARAGIRRGDRVLLMVRPGVAFVALMFAHFKMGATPILIDPGMGVRRLLDCIREVPLDAFIGVPAAQAVRVFRSGCFNTVRTVVTVGHRWFWGGPTLGQLSAEASDRFEPVEPRPGDPAAILFTSGSTGPAKGVIYEHGMFAAQIRMIQSHYGMMAGEIDLPTFPMFGLFSIAMGMTVVIPEMDASRPGRVNPGNIVRAVHRHGVTTSFGSPALWNRVAEFCLKRSIRLNSLRRVLIAGAPVSPRIIEDLSKCLPVDARIHTPYGATEALPVASICNEDHWRELAERTRHGAGTCVGRALPGADARIIPITDGPILDMTGACESPVGEIGEITVAGPMVTQSYFQLPAAIELAKIRDGDRFRHRMGDVGYRDAEGRIWFCGRKSQRVRTIHGDLYTECWEGIFNAHSEVAHSALVGVGRPGRQRPVVIVEPRHACFPRGRRIEAFAIELAEWAAAGLNVKLIVNPATISADDPHSAGLLFRRRLPVDNRHNAKINRERLAQWAAKHVSVVDGKL